MSVVTPRLKPQNKSIKKSKRSFTPHGVETALQARKKKEPLRDQGLFYLKHIEFSCFDKMIDSH